MITAINKALYAKRNELEKDEKGFTLIELLVVVIIIGILAAIAIPVFLNQREGAWRAEVESDLKNAAIAAETHATENAGSYATLDGAALTAAGFRPSNAATVFTVAATSGEYSIVANHPDLTDDLTYDSDGGGLLPWP